MMGGVVNIRRLLAKRWLTHGKFIMNAQHAGDATCEVGNQLPIVKSGYDSGEFHHTVMYGKLHEVPARASSCAERDAKSKE